MRKRKILVTGATGFLGHNLVERFCARDDLEVFGTYFRTEPRDLLARNPNLQIVRADLTKSEDVTRVVAGCDVIIQAAAVTTGAKDTVTRPYIHVTDNAIMNALLFRAAFEQKVKHVVFFSCTTMYASSTTPQREEDFNYQIADKYFGVAWTKVYNEKMCEFYSRIGPTKFTVIRHSNIYGPYDKFDLDRSHVFGATITKVMNAADGKVVVWGDGTETRDLLYVSDLVDFVELIAERQQDKFELVNLGSGTVVSIRELVERIASIAVRKIVIEYDRTKPTIQFSLAVSIDRAVTKYGWRPRVSLDEGIKRTLDWFMAKRATNG